MRGFSVAMGASRHYTNIHVVIWKLLLVFIGEQASQLPDQEEENGYVCDYVYLLR